MKNPAVKVLLAASLIAICELVGFLSSLSMRESVALWYPVLVKPSFNPPAWLFGPVWTVLYATMGLALYFVIAKQTSLGKTSAVVAFVVQLLLNSLWSPAFFGMRSPELGLVVILLLVFAIIVTTALFFRISRTAGALMIPYLAWVGFATVLNAAIALLN